MSSNSNNEKTLKQHRGAMRREHTRADLLAAARKIFAIRGYHDASILDITEEANVGVGTFYLHFRDKDEAFDTLLDEVLHSLREQITAEVRRDGEPSLSLIVHTIFHHAYEQRDLFHIGLTGGGQVTRMFHMQEMIALGLSDTLERFAAKGLLHNYDLALLARLITGVIIQGVNWWFEQDEPGPDFMAEQILQLLSQGLPPQVFMAEGEKAT